MGVSWLVGLEKTLCLRLAAEVGVIPIPATIRVSVPGTLPPLPGRHRLGGSPEATDSGPRLGFEVG
jgi:hypothetical protein